MNRREAIAALTAIPGLTRISKADLKPTDVLVCECDGMMSNETAERVKAFIQQVWPDNKVIVLSDGLKLKVVSQLNA